MVDDARPSRLPASAAGQPAAVDPTGRILQGLEQVAKLHLDWHGTIRSEQRLVETLRLDSLRLLTLVVEVENHFRICLDEGAEAEIETVDDLVAVIRSKLERIPEDAE